MNVWLAAVVATLPPLALPIWVALTGRAAARLIAVQLASSVAALALVLMSFAFDQPSFIDLPLTLAFLSLPGTLLFARGRHLRHVRLSGRARAGERIPVHGRRHPCWRWRAGWMKSNCAAAARRSGPPALPSPSAACCWPGFRSA